MLGFVGKPEWSQDRWGLDSGGRRRRACIIFHPTIADLTATLTVIKVFLRQPQLQPHLELGCGSPVKLRFRVGVNLSRVELDSGDGAAGVWYLISRIVVDVSDVLHVLRSGQREAESEAADRQDPSRGLPTTPFHQLCDTV